MGSMANRTVMNYDVDMRAIGFPLKFCQKEQFLIEIWTLRPRGPHIDIWNLHVGNTQTVLNRVQTSRDVPPPHRP